MQNLNNVSLVFDFFDILKLGSAIIIFLIMLFGFLRHFIRKEWRLYKNLQRPIMIITPSNNNGAIPGKGMELEIEKLRESRLFNITDKMTDYRNFDPQDDYCLVVLGYDKDMIGLDEVIIKIKNLQIPLIVYTYGKNEGAFDPNDMAILNGYPWTFIANFKLTLINSIFNTLATYPYGKRKNK